MPKGIPNIPYSNYLKVLWRLFRTAVVTSIAQVLVLSVDWSNPEEAARTIAVSFVAGLFAAFGKGIRLEFGSKNKDSKIDKIPL